MWMVDPERGELLNLWGSRLSWGWLQWDTKISKMRRCDGTLYIYIYIIFVLFSDKMNGTIWNPICIWMFIIVYGFTSPNISYNLVLEAIYCFMLRTFSVGPCNKKRFQQQCVETHLLQRVLSRVPAKDSKGRSGKTHSVASSTHDMSMICMMSSWNLSFLSFKESKT